MTGDAVLFGRFRVQRELGRGGMGVVLLAFDETLGQPVAVKLLSELLINDAEAIADLKKELLRGRALMHPGIIRTHTFERDAATAAIVMEFIEGDSLAELKARQPGKCFDPEQILGWIEQLCEVLDYAHHDARIAHRDLKPRNIMVTPTGRVKVADFGISSGLSDSLSRISVRADSSGTPTYMSPQQISGQRASHLDDIYALGSTIYELLTSKPPFFRGNAAAIYGQVLNVVPPTMAARREELGVFGRAPILPEWEHAVAACLAKEPAQRPQSAGELRLRICGSPRRTRGFPATDGNESHSLREPATVPAVHAPAPAKPALPAARNSGLGELTTRARSELSGASVLVARSRRWPWFALAVIVIAVLGVLVTSKFGTEVAPLNPVPPLDPGTSEAADQPAAEEGKMTEPQARALLESLHNEEERVRLIDPNERERTGRVLRNW